jgi:hypothetical protein
VDAGLPDRHRPDPGADRPLREAAVAHHLATPTGVAAVAAPVDPVGYLGLDSLGQEPLGALAEDLAKDILCPGQ